MPPAIPDKIPCESVQQLGEEIATFREILSHEETEETWDRIASGLTRFGAIVKGGGYKFERELLNGVKVSARPIVSALNSERTRLSAAALECISIIAPRVGLSFEPLVSHFIPPILRLSTRSNKVYVTRSQATLGLILGYCHIPSIIPHLLVACKESKIATGRAVALESVLRCLNKWDWTQRETRSKVGDVEEIIRITGRDKDAGIRQTSRRVFETYKNLFPERVDEFTDPLTPVMRKYLDIKPLPFGQKPTQRAHLPSKVENPRQPQARQDFAASTSAIPSSTTNDACAVHVRSASSNAAVAPSTARDSKSHSTEVVAVMPPPAIIPNHSRNAARSQAQSHTDDQPEEQTPYGRQRVISAASSTYSVKSAPPDSYSRREHCPPMRLINSQNTSTRVNHAVTGSSGQARRVRKETALEPHPANRPDLMAMVQKAPTRSIQLQNANAPRDFKGNQRPVKEVLNATQSVTQNEGVVFPTSESACALSVERRGAQRVPKQITPAPAISVATPPKAERPAAALGDVAKGEVKPSMFRRDVVGTPRVGPKDTKKKKQEGFVPRRGGGVTQPTLSQLNKRKTPVSVDGIAARTGQRAARAPAVLNRPAWGTGGSASRTVSTRDLLITKGGKQGGIGQPRTLRLADKLKAGPAMVPLPPSPDSKKDLVPHMVPLPASPKSGSPDSGQTNVLHVDKATTAEVREVATSAIEAEDVVDEERIKGEDAGPHNSQQVDVDARVEEDPGAHQFSVKTTVAKDTTNAVITQTLTGTHTPPFPSADTESESEEDELEDIEFTSRNVYTPGGMPIKTPRKLGVLATDKVLARSPLGEVVLNE